MKCERNLAKCQAQCCGPVPFDPKTYRKHKKLREVKKEMKTPDGLIVPVTEDLTCPFLDNFLRCSVYEERPDVCRKFGDGSHPLLVCPYKKPSF